MTKDLLADRARQLAESYPSRTSGRRAAAALYVALTTSRTLDAARRALNTFGDPHTRAAAAQLFDELQRETA
jgi:hypothetical protein